MTKQFIVHGRNDNTISLEFSELRLNWYKTIVELWNDPKRQSQFNTFLFLFQDKGGKAETKNADDIKELISILSKEGLLHIEPSKKSETGMWKNYHVFKPTFVDPTFFNSCFYTNENSDVIHLTTIHLVETTQVNGKDQQKDINLREKFTPEKSRRFDFV